MAEKRMFTQKIIDSDAFLDMPLSAQALYFHLAMRADDDGFVNNPKKITRYIGSAEDDLKMLLAKRFIIIFESGVIVIKHWRMHNAIKKDRYHPTDYREEYARLETKENGAYTERVLSPAAVPVLTPGAQTEPECNQNGAQTEPEIRLDKIRLGLDKGRLDQSSIDINNNKYNYSSTRQANLSDTTLLVTRESKPPISLYLADGSATSPESGEIERLKAAFPSVDIEAEFYKAAEWLRANPDKRPTIDRLSAFIFGWMRNAQKDEKNPPPARTGKPHNAPLTGTLRPETVKAAYLELHGPRTPRPARS